MASLFPLEQVEEILFLMCKTLHLESTYLRSRGMALTPLEGKDLKVLVGKAIKARLAVALTMTKKSKSQTEMQIETFLFSLSPVSSYFVPAGLGS